MKVIALVEDFAIDLRIQLAKPADLSILLRDQFLIHGGDLDEQVILGQIEIGSEELRWCSITAPGYWEGSGLVLPVDTVEVQ